ncbi:MAG TPA: M20/M25/M40 family metallo-hydrolase [Bryobacteraceae bacterium]|nr:M20/M25/M40 family metallo-hydrolase [Bryobacteraceae bacterium]
MLARIAPLLVMLPLAPDLLAAAPDFRAAGEEAVRLLSGYLKIDTVNPPGHETRGAEYLKQILGREGISAEIFESAPGRGNLVARIKGNGAKKPVLIMGHIDTVGVEREKWTLDPFGGLVRDGFVYGRGAVDDKTMGTACLEVMLLLHRLKIPLDRDVIFLAEAGEESSTEFGIDFMVEKHWDRIAAEFSLAEGGGMSEQDGVVRRVVVTATEKLSRNMKVVAHGVSAHGSVPRADNPLLHLSTALLKLAAWRPPMRLNEVTRAYFSRLATISPPEEAFLYTHLEDPAVQEKIRARNPSLDALLRVTITPTITRGGFRDNTIPATAEATLMVRPLPDEDVPALMQRMREVIDDPAVEVIPAWGRRPVAPPSGLGTEMFTALERVQKRLFPQAITLPAMATGTTDSAQLRAKGVQAYGIGTFGAIGAHGNDERVSVRGLGALVEFLYNAVVEVAATK